MDLRQIEYIISIADESSITRAAEKLYLSQSGLNQQLLKLEHELGIQLFHRSKNDLHLTEAGKVYVEYGRQILHLKKEAYNILNDLADNKVGHLSVGLTPDRGIDMLIGIYPDFYQAFPNITIEPLEIKVKQQLSMISKGYLDLGFVTLTDADKTNDTFIPIKKEDILLGIPRSHPMAGSANPPNQPYATIDLSLFREDRFILMFQGSTLRNVIDPLFAEAEFQPNVLFETASNQTLYTMVKNNMGCTLIPETHAKAQEDVAYFYLPQRPRWELAAIYKKGYYQTKAARYFIELAVNYWTSSGAPSESILKESMLTNTL